MESMINYIPYTYIDTTTYPYINLNDGLGNIC